MIKPDTEKDLQEGISVIVPSYQGERWILKCLDSLANQTLDKSLFEVIIIINGKKDNTENLVDDFIGKHPDFNLKKIVLEEAGAAHARNIGIKNASRKFSIFIDDDDYISENYLKGLYTQAENNTIVIAPQIIDVEPDGTFNQKNYLNTEISEILHKKNIPDSLDLKYTLSINALKLIPTSYLKSNHFHTDLKSGEDIVLFTILAVNGNLNYKIVNPQENVIYYRLKREDSVSRQALSYSFNVEERLAVIRELNTLLINVSSDEAKNFIINKIDAQASFIKKYVDEIIHENTKEIKETIEHLDLTYFPDSIFATEQINEKYHKATKQIDHYKNQLNELETALKNAQSDLKSSASYQLGHLLIHEIRSISDILRLPRKIMNIKSKKKVSAKPSTKKNNTIRDIDFSNILKTDKKTHDLKIACIMDPFTYESYLPEAIFQQLTPKGWENEIKTFSPDLLFIESAWRGKDELWWNAVGKKCDELVAIVKYCNKHNIPTAFWNKEDPVHFNTFINTAALFDFIFTTDIDMIDAYKTALQHNRVHLLTFACQPIVNNPLEKYERKDAFCFAGAYYVRYPERTKDLDEFMLHLPEIKPIEIYDRNYGKEDPTYMFPEQFKPYIVGTLPFEKIDKAYKGYNYAINLNSVKQSQSMFARRVYEVLASNTITISNFSRAVRILFGDLVITSDSGTECVKRVQDLVKDEVSLKKHKLITLRKVLSEHTYKDRLEFLVSKVFNKKREDSTPFITAVCFVQNEEAYQSCLKNFDRQEYHHKHLLVIADMPIDTKGRDDIEIMPSDRISSSSVAEVCPEADYITRINGEHYYCTYYFTDMALSTSYFNGDVIGKATYYEYLDNDKLKLEAEDTQYHILRSIPLYAALLKKEKISHLDMNTFLNAEESRTLGNLECLSIDEFNYCKNGENLTSEQITLIEANTIKNSGISMPTLINYSEKSHGTLEKNSGSTYLSGNTLTSTLTKKNISDVIFESKEGSVTIRSNMPSDKHQNIYNPDLYNIEALEFDPHQKICFDMTVGLSLHLIVVYYDEKKQKISHQSIMPNQNAELFLPENTKWVQFGFRIQGPGNVRLNALELEHRVLSPSVLIGQAEHLVLTNLYPSYDNLYRNGFVHARVKAYQSNDIKVDVFKLQENTNLSYSEFENVDITTGSADALRNLLINNQYKSILVHFLNEAMWDVLKDYINKINIFVWVHGTEVQPWTRRKHLFETDEAIEKAKIQSKKRISFWKELLSTSYKNLHLIFVSQYLAKSVMEDLTLTIPTENYKIIHNFINTDLFTYIPKNVEQRKKILSIRPYANDLSIKAILELSEKPYFSDLSFHIIGDGILFDEITEPLRNFENVIIEKKFLTQEEIAHLHKEYGIFLCPSRIDTQGVSRDEAMSSGLIPVTNGVTAIPEFIDEKCGFLADGDDAHGLAEGIATIYENPELFQRMSEAAAKRVREQCGFEETIGRELNIFKSRNQKIN